MKTTSLFNTRNTVSAVVLTIATFTPAAWADNDGDTDDRDMEILSFSTVGDSRQDPATPDPTTLPLSGQDAIWLQNTKALSRILRSIVATVASALLQWRHDYGLRQRYRAAEQHQRRWHR